MTNVVWLKLTTVTGSTTMQMFGAGGIVEVKEGPDDGASLYSSKRHVIDVKQSIDEIMELIGAVRRGVHEGNGTNYNTRDAEATPSN